MLDFFTRSKAGIYDWNRPQPSLGKQRNITSFPDKLSAQAPCWIEGRVFARSICARGALDWHRADADPGHRLASVWTKSAGQVGHSFIGFSKMAETTQLERILPAYGMVWLLVMSAYEQEAA